MQLSKNILVKILVMLIFFAAGFRFIWLDIFPVGMYHDEVEYQLSAKRYALFGADLSGTPFPDSLITTETDGKISPVPPLLLSPLYLIFPLTQFSSRLIYVVISLLTAVVLYLLVQILFKKQTLSLLTGLIYLINPWSFYLSRYAADTPFALLFFLAGIYTFLRFNKWGLLSSLALFTLGFFSYHGAKPLFIPVIAVLIIYKLNQKGSKKIKQLGLFCIGGILVIGMFSLFSFINPKSSISDRGDELFFLDRDSIIKEVNIARQQSVENPLTEVFINYYTVSFKIFTEKYLTSFSPEVLFLKGDPRSTYRFETHGLFYIVEAVFILIGLLSVYLNSKKTGLLITSLIVIAPITTAISNVETSVINRSFLLLPLLLILVSLGMYSFIKSFSNTKIRLLMITVITTSYMIQILNFSFFYFIKYPVTHQESYFLSEKIASQIMPSDTTVVYSKDLFVRAAFLSHVFYSDSDVQNKALESIYPASKKGPIYFEQLTFQSECPSKITGGVFIMRDSDCSIDGIKNGSILDQKDAGEVIKMYNTTLCMKGAIEGYKRFHNLSDYYIETMPLQSLCNSWIKK